MLLMQMNLVFQASKYELPKTDQCTSRNTAHQGEAKYPGAAQATTATCDGGKGMCLIQIQVYW